MSERKDVLSSDIRLRVCAALYGVNRSKFSDIKESLGVTDSSLSKCLRSLEEADYVTIVKRRTGRSYETIVSLTGYGIAEYESHRRYIRDILNL